MRLLLGLAADGDYEIYKFDVKTAFLHGELKEEIFMELPPGCEGAEDNPGEEAKTRVVLLKHSLYGLKQASHDWNEKFCAFVINFNFVCSDNDKCVFIGRIDDFQIYLCVHVDDGLLISKSKSAIFQCLTSSLLISKSRIILRMIISDL